jgi:methylenetetrahydrofolate dehydrogenase (NADP+)/methenyltetrahydrofolate cyclohydrolase
MAERIDGKEIAARVRAEVAAEIAARVAEGKAAPGLAVVIVGEDPASQVYVRNKRKACLEVGIRSETYAMPADTTMEELLARIDALNADPAVHGILVQLPLPAHLDAKAVLARVAPAKDADAFHPLNMGRLLEGTHCIAPGTPAGMMELLHRYGIPVEGKRCVVLGRSDIVGKPMALLLLHGHGTVTVCHSRTQNLREICREADILVVAIGKAGFLKADMVKPGAVVLDVGINRTEDGKLVGDVDFAAVEPVASYITPVPGGVGPMTIAMLLKNTLTLAQNQEN